MFGRKEPDARSRADELADAERRRVARLDQLTAERDDVESRLEALSERVALVRLGLEHDEAVERERDDLEERLAAVRVEIDEVVGAASVLQRLTAEARVEEAERCLGYAERAARAASDVAEERERVALHARRTADSLAVAAEVNAEALDEERTELGAILAGIEKGEEDPRGAHRARLEEQARERAGQDEEIVKWAVTAYKGSASALDMVPERLRGEVLRRVEAERARSSEILREREEQLAAELGYAVAEGGTGIRAVEQ
jgi:hypothetical protein